LMTLFPTSDMAHTFNYVFPEQIHWQMSASGCPTSQTFL